MKIAIWVVCALLVTACGKDEHKPFETAYLHIMNNEASTATVSHLASVVATYNIYLSSAPLQQNLEVDFEVVPGNGLKEGVDYERVTKGAGLLFLPGIYDMPVRVRWLPTPSIDPSKDNTLTIRLLSNNLGINIGQPGPDHLQREFVITKI